MSTILLVRHASCDGMGLRLNGRSAGVRLTAQGRNEAQVLARNIAHYQADIILTSPRERCQETADILASFIRVPVETFADLDEVDFGAWNGLRFDELAGDPDWTRWNDERATEEAPAGESMADVQRRMSRALAIAAARAARRAVILVSHAEPIRAAIAGVLGSSLDCWSRLEISPASLSRLDATGNRVLLVNQTFL